VFCSIVSGDLQSEIIDSSDTCLAINDNSPVASTHVLVIPREHVLYLSDLDHKDLYIVQDMYALARNF
jgi:histidine triad (HIT) family protein